MGHFVPESYRYGDVVLQIWGFSNLRQINTAVSTVGLGSQNDCAGEAQQ
jgi:hypothetical protein